MYRKFRNVDSQKTNSSGPDSHCAVGDHYLGGVEAHIKDWQDTDNYMVEGDDDPIPTPPEDDGGEQRQRDADLNAELRRITRKQIEVLEKMDPELFLEELDCDWRDHFKHDVWVGINFYMEFMSPTEFKKVLKASQ